MIMMVMTNLFDKGYSLDGLHHHKIFGTVYLNQPRHPGIEPRADIHQHPGLHGFGHGRRRGFEYMGAGAGGHQHLNLHLLSTDVAAKVA